MSLVSKSFLRDIFGSFKPGKGSVFVEKSRQNRRDDEMLAKYFKRKFGGEYVILSDIAPHGVKVPDILLTKRAIFENKKVTSLQSLDSQTRRALFQLDKDNLKKLKINLRNKELRHVLVIQIEKGVKLDYEDVVGTIMHRINRHKINHPVCINYVMIRENGKIKLLLKIK